MPHTFSDALESGDIQAIRACPKADLHTHGLANADRAYVLEKTGRDIVPVATPLESMDGMHAWAQANIGNLFEGQAGRTLGIDASFAGCRALWHKEIAQIALNRSSRTS